MFTISSKETTKSHRCLNSASWIYGIKQQLHPLAFTPADVDTRQLFMLTLAAVPPVYLALGSRKVTTTSIILVMIIITILITMLTIINHTVIVFIRYHRHHHLHRNHPYIFLPTGFTLWIGAQVQPGEAKHLVITAL